MSLEASDELKMMRSVRMRDGEVTLHPNEMFTLVYTSSAISSPKIVVSENIDRAGEPFMADGDDNTKPGGSITHRLNLIAPGGDNEVGTVFADIRTPNGTYDKKQLLIVRTAEPEDDKSRRSRRNNERSPISFVASGYIYGTAFDFAFTTENGKSFFKDSRTSDSKPIALSEQDAVRIWRIADRLLYADVFRPWREHEYPGGADIGEVLLHYKDHFATPEQVPQLVAEFTKYARGRGMYDQIVHPHAAAHRSDKMLTTRSNGKTKVQKNVNDDDDEKSETASTSSSGAGSDLMPSYSGLKDYDMPKLWNLTKDNKVHRLMVADVQPFLSNGYWDDGLKPRDVMLDRGRTYKREWDAIMKADLDYPILVVWPRGESQPTDILDGLHRLARASLMGKRTIKAQIVTDEQLARSLKKIDATHSGDVLHVPLYTSSDGLTSVTHNEFAARHAGEEPGIIPMETHSDKTQWVACYEGSLLVTVNGIVHTCSPTSKSVLVEKNQKHEVKQHGVAKAAFISVYKK